MTDNVMIAAIVASALAPVVAAVAGYINNRAIQDSSKKQERMHAENTQKLAVATDTLDKLEHNTDGISAKLIAVTDSAIQNTFALARVKLESEIGEPGKPEKKK